MRSRALESDRIKGMFDHLWSDTLTRFTVRAGPLDLEVQAAADIRQEAQAAVRRRWGELDAYLAGHPSFGASLGPVAVRQDAPPVARAMAEAASLTGVGPMVALPGALTEEVCRDLADLTQVMVSAEGDTFVAGIGRRTHPLPSPMLPGGRAAGLYVVSPGPYAFYCSTGRSKVGAHVGQARVAVLAERGALADAAASALGLLMVRPEQVRQALAMARHIDGVHAGVLSVEDQIAVWGDVELVGPPGTPAVASPDRDRA